MRVLLLGATGMVGQGVLRECLLSSAVQQVVAPVREPLPAQSPKLQTILHSDFLDWSFLDLAAFDACFFCLGISAVGKSEAEYRRVTYDLTLALAQALVKASPQAVFCYVSGQGTDANGRSMWARVKGQTENALLAMPFRAVYCFRPGYIQPLHGIRSKVRWYQAMYDLLRWTYPFLRRFTKAVTSTEQVGLAMLHVARSGWPDPVLGNLAINSAAAIESPGP